MKHGKVLCGLIKHQPWCCEALDVTESLNTPLTLLTGAIVPAVKICCARCSTSCSECMRCSYSMTLTLLTADAIVRWDKFTYFTYLIFVYSITTTGLTSRHKILIEQQRRPLLGTHFVFANQPCCCDGCRHQRKGQQNPSLS